MVNATKKYLLLINDGHSSYDKLLNLDNSALIHHKNLQTLAIEIFRLYTGSATDILNKVFPLKPPSNYNLRNQQEFTIWPMKTVHYRLNSLAYLGPKIWELLPNNVKILKSVEAFQSKIKSWIPENCSCRICEPYIYQVGFI